MQRLLLATRNAHKTREVRQILGAGFEVIDLCSAAHIPPVEEIGSTFEENARLKAVTASLHFQGLVLADDSGLEVDALAGEPGVRSARYAGDSATDKDNRMRLLEELALRGMRGKDRSARFRCVLVLACRGDVLAVTDGAVEGVIINQPKGGGGFGYDPLFVPEGKCETFAQLEAAVKNEMSHRGRALAAMAQRLKAMAESAGS